jgi:radical SAM superfamily enzyme YgiQ (UPF0313 family)
MKIVLVQAPFYPVMLPSLGVAYVNAILRREGHSVEIIDFNHIDKPLYSFLQQFELAHPLDPDNMQSFMENLRHSLVVDKLTQDWTNKILSLKPDIVGFSIYSISLFYSMIMAHKLKSQSSAVVVFGGPELANHYTVSRLQELESVDFLVQGEGEYAIKKVLDIVRNNVRPEKVIRSDTISVNDLPPPEYEPKVIRQCKYPNVLPIIMSRGCPFQCTFCVTRYAFEDYRQRDVESVIDEIRYQQRKHGISSFFFCDHLINAKHHNLLLLSDALIHRRLKIYWGAHVKADYRIDRKLCQHLYDSGCRFFRIGAESGSQRVLDHMRKGITVGTVEQTITNAHEVGIHASVSIIVGYPTETERDFSETRHFLARNRRKIDTFVPLRFIYHSAYFDRSHPLYDLEDIAEDVKTARKQALSNLPNCALNNGDDLFLAIHGVKREYT